MILPFVATNCPLQLGDWWTADSTRGITLDSTALGRIYFSKGDGGISGSYKTATERLIMIVKNASSSTLARNMAVKFAVAATGDFMQDISGLAGANERVAGFVEDGYTAGVPDGAYFRLVIEGEHYAQYFGSTDTQVATVPGEPLVCAGSGKVFGQDAAVAAGAATFGQVNGVCGFAAEVTVNDATAWDVYKKIYVKAYYI